MISPGTPFIFKGIPADDISPDEKKSKALNVNKFKGYWNLDFHVQKSDL